MRAIIALLLSLWLAPALAQVPMTGAGKGSPTGITYQGPGDVFSTSAIGFWSCSRVWNAAAANTSTNLCDLVAVTGGAAVCTLRGSATGFVDQSAYCGGSTPSAACAAASGGSCTINKIYNQVSPGTMDFVTAGVNPPVVFNADPSGTLPVIYCGNGPTLYLPASSTLTQNQPYTMSTVYKRPGTTSPLAWGDNAATNVGIGGRSATAATGAFGGGTLASVTAADNTWHALSGLGNGASGATNIDGTDASASTGTTNLSGATFRMCRPNGSTQFNGYVAEAIMWGASTNATDRGNINTNQHSAANGYNF